MDFELTDEQKLLINTVREFTEKEIEPKAEQMERGGRLPDDLIKKMADIQLLGMTFPEEFGGIDAGTLECVLAIEEMSYSGTGAWWLPAFSNSIPGCIVKFGTKEQKTRYLKPVSEGNIYPSIQFTEADTGSDPDGLITKATLKGNHYVINGMKRFSSFGARDGYALLYAKDDEGQCTAFIIEKNIDGYFATSNYELMGSGGMEASDVHFDNLKVHEDNILGKKGQGMKILQFWIADEKIQQCGACLGIARSALDEAIAYVKSRKVRKRPMSNLQGIRWLLADMHSQLEAARWLTYRTAALKDSSARNWITEAATAKLFVVPATMEIVNMARRIHGSYGYLRESKIERLYRAIAGASAIAVSLEINKSIVGASFF